MKTRQPKPLPADAGAVFRFRADCGTDVLRLVKRCERFCIMDFAMKRAGNYPDFNARIRLLRGGLAEIRQACRQVPDGHVMLQTLQPEDSYTGERDTTLL